MKGGTMKKVILITMIVAGCSIFQIDPKPIPVDPHLCRAAEMNIERLRCRDQKGNEMWINLEGERFEKTCLVLLESGIKLNTQCLVNAKSCSEIDKCPR